jgi:Fe-S cluster biosynthesis and repair protein YggX
MCFVEMNLPHCPEAAGRGGKRYEERETRFLSLAPVHQLARARSGAIGADLPFPGRLGERIYDEVSQQAWNMWPQQSTLVINHYGLNLADPQAQKLLMQQMEEFFFGEGAQMPEGWTPQAQSGKGGAHEGVRISLAFDQGNDGPVGEADIAECGGCRHFGD